MGLLKLFVKGETPARAGKKALRVRGAFIGRNG
jgi:hypothetical protein